MRSVCHCRQARDIGPQQVNREAKKQSSIRFALFVQHRSGRQLRCTAIPYCAVPRMGYQSGDVGSIGRKCVDDIKADVYVKESIDLYTCNYRRPRLLARIPSKKWKGFRTAAYVALGSLWLGLIIDAVAGAHDA